uniref:AMNP/g12777 n=1 Tax=Ramazzottius varieornatus TaxID=947166 RepID=UPI001CEE0832|nr:Chain A, AMNP/g12777 [Ramazzottius varieornatus]7DBT_B Chain B, AMNP/g12777 [Ramazzottius varieornatus]7DBU_A Chain A, AMNP/g12777 [Ramazzottius varieornatus]7DBU_B Chain B, AMNP/g12777 [Ramazzottius varieornatus]
GSHMGRFADFFRIETEIQRLDNPAGILANGKKCDFTGACDPVVTAFLDLESPLSPWPGSVAASKWKTIFEATDQNSPTIGRSVIRDMCGGSASNVNLRVLVNDADSLSSQDEIGKFSCLFQLDARDVAMDSLSAQWGPSTECTAEAQQGKIRLFARRRAFEIPSTSCRAPSSL